MARTHRDLTTWRKSTYSGPDGGDCIEVADSSMSILVRDTKNRTGAVLDIKPAEWRRFTTALQP